MLLPILLLAFLILLNGIFAMAELAMMTSRKSRLLAASKSGSRAAATALALAREPTRFLSTVQVGITLIGILAGAFGENFLANKLGPVLAGIPYVEAYADTLALVLVVLVLTYFSLVFGELVPKRIALAHPEAIASAIARPLQFVSLVAAWPIRVLSASTDALLALLRIRPRNEEEVSEEDVKELMSRAASTGVFTPQEHGLIQRTMRLADLRVRDLMVPHPAVVWIDRQAPSQEIRKLLVARPHTQFPFCNGDLDRVLGMIHTKDLIASGYLAGTECDPGSLARAPLLVPAQMPALRLLDQFQSGRTHVALVVDELGGTQGLVTLDDVTAALVGNPDGLPAHLKPGMVRRESGEWLIDGHVSVDELESALDLGTAPDADEPPEANTVGGLVAELLGHIPAEGEHVLWRGWRFEVLDMDGARVDKLQASRAS